MLLAHFKLLFIYAQKNPYLNGILLSQLTFSCKNGPCGSHDKYRRRYIIYRMA